MNACRICGNGNGNNRFKAYEMMYGWGDEFDYFECSSCGCIQIADIPKDISRFYPADYYSLAKEKVRPAGKIKSFIKRERSKRFLLDGKNVIGRFIAAIYPPPDILTLLKKAGACLDSKILDVGCGSGKLLLKLRKEGFTSLTGLDTNLAENIDYDNGVKLYKGEIGTVPGSFDIVMMHHVLEHIADPVKALREIHGKLAARGRLIVRMPVAGTYAWRKYGKDWVQFDPPRHVIIHTEKSMKLIADKTGFAIREIEYDSGDFQFWGSEKIKRGLALKAQVPGSLAEEIFSEEKMGSYREKAAELNKEHDGDSAVFILKKAGI